MPGPAAPSRRTVLRGAAAVPVAGAVVAACSPGERSDPTPPAAPVDLGGEKDVGPGESRLYRDERVVVSRSAEGSLRAYSAVCTHGGCPMTKLEGAELTCFCHGSRFDATTGEVLRKPATVALPELPVRVERGRIVAGPEA
ncbi:Rieske (2Fe-2S) protein [Streptomyces sp. ZYX-F-203]|uniref:Rieske (2Fe-2S) protein n=1 Tax=Streptomyces sp. HSG2 TaxID=2797167 RepID=UPI0019045E76|nr:Rieske (2Fe-2S) protein [Streptomyces sp. HSG2]